MLCDELICYFRTLSTPGEAQGFDGVFVVAGAGYDWSAHPDNSVHAAVLEDADARSVAEAHRALCPGGHLFLVAPDEEPVGYSAACEAEDSGFEVRDCFFVADHADDKLHYVAKASRSEREAGLDDFEPQAVAMSGGANAALAEGAEDYDEGPGVGLNRVKQRRNIHPTVKPVAVMERLLADVPRGGLVLDPFLGSGTTGIAAVRTGHLFAGIEKEEEYQRIAEARIRAASPKP
jgi:hypothetical protein